MERKARAGTAEAIADRLHSAAIHLLRRVRRQDAASGLSAARLSALSVIVYGGPLRLGDLAAAEQVSSPTMTRLVAALEEDGLVERQEDPEDGRAVRLSATRRGREILDAGRRRRVADLAAMLAELEPQELERLEEAVALLERALAGDG